MCGQIGVITNASRSGLNDRPAGGKRVGGRTGGSGHDKSVGAIAADVVAIDIHIEIEHASERGFVGHGVVQRASAAPPLLPLRKISASSIMRSPMRCSSLEDLFEQRIQLVESDAGEKSEAAQIHGEDGNVVSVQRRARRKAACRRRRERSGDRLSRRALRGRAHGTFQCDAAPASRRPRTHRYCAFAARRPAAEPRTRPFP